MRQAKIHSYIDGKEMGVNGYYGTCMKILSFSVYLSTPHSSTSLHVRYLKLEKGGGGGGGGGGATHMVEVHY